MKKYIFDVDGTLTPSRGKIDAEFLQFMLFFAGSNDVYLVTGSDRQKTLEQVGLDLYNSCKRVYNCSGSDVYEADKNVYKSDWTLPKDVEIHLIDELNFSKFPMRNGNHIERRPGGVNFSILGRDKDPFKGRSDYISWDKIHQERDYIARRLRYNFSNLSVALGGQTGVDIGPLGSDKSQILRDFNDDDELYFFGDRVEEGGNDHTIAKGVEKRCGFAYNVEDYTETWKLLSKYD